MLQAKRQNFRKHQRKLQLQKFFMLQRLKLTQGQSAVYQQLFCKIQSFNSESQIDMGLLLQLTNILSTHPNDQNTYILLGNFMITFPMSWSVIAPYINQEVNLSEHHAWMILVITTKMIDEEGEDGKIGQHIEDFDAVMSKCVRHLADFLMHQENITIERRDEKIMAYFAKFISQITSRCRPEHFPYQCFQSFSILMEVLRLKHLFTQISESIKSLFCQFVTHILNERISNLKEYEIVQFLRSVPHAIRYLLMQMPDEREYCITGLTKAFTFHHCASSQNLLTKGIFDEIIYLFTQSHHLKEPISQFFQEIVLQNFDKRTLQVFLENRVHIHLAEALEWSYNRKMLDCAFNCLNSIYLLLSKLNHQSQFKLVERVLQSLADHHFEQLITEMENNETQNQNITHVLNNLMDDFYSSEIE